ncbi:hypothetical protein IHQ11_14730 [Priestia megaterium]|uniref:hypothetical protein n=1 Tax=Priestia megaterium TaxID=1404 RepID=UPI001B39FB0D|nr:hypothetical protein [Priestia megaterium]MBQ4867756.1 hypothetical protein [Priestia megaterium]MDD1512938.1 hypothetical protein [Priestia megaterium]MEB2274264.1 hypothetical protein [Bacillus sp. ILBB4]
MKKRTKTIIAVIAGAAILIGGIWMINESRYPNVPAFDDHFTREFLNKDKKVDDGFYEFKSKTGQYTMWFPEEYQLIKENEEDYVINDNSYERWIAKDVNNKAGDTGEDYIEVTFSNARKAENESFTVENMFKEQLNTTKPNNFETSSTRIYYDSAYTYFKGTQEVVKHNSKEHAPNTYIAYIVDKKSNNAIELWFDKSKGSQKNNEVTEKKWLLTILKNIRFREGNENE